jgi:hypothetical protein
MTNDEMTSIMMAGATRWNSRRFDGNSLLPNTSIHGDQHTLSMYMLYAKNAGYTLLKK